VTYQDERLKFEPPHHGRQSERTVHKNLAKGARLGLQVQGKAERKRKAQFKTFVPRKNNKRRRMTEVPDSRASQVNPSIKGTLNGH
jgi:hypothetical protein